MDLGLGVCGFRSEVVHHNGLQGLGWLRILTAVVMGEWEVQMEKKHDK